MILVIGATGTVGGEVVKQLIAAGERVRVLARDPAKAANLGGKVDVAQGDLARPEALGAAFAGVERAFVVTAGFDLPVIEGNAFEAAARAGVKHVVKLSGQGAEHAHGTQLTRWHRASEARLLASGVPWTILRPGWFAANAFGWAPSIKAEGAVFAPTGDGKTTPIHTRDIADVAVKVLTSPGHEGKSYALTGPKELRIAEQVETLGAALGRPLRYVDVPEAAARAGMLASGMPEPLVDVLLELMALVRSGGAAGVTSTVAELLGREPLTFDAWVRDHLAAFQ